MTLYAVFFYVRYALSYRDLKGIMAERGVIVGHTALNRWVLKFSPMILAEAHKRKRRTALSWRRDETYIKVKGERSYYDKVCDRTLAFEIPVEQNA